MYHGDFQTLRAEMAAGRTIAGAGRSVDLTPVHAAIESHQGHFSLLLQRIWDEAQIAKNLVIFGLNPQLKKATARPPFRSKS